MFHQVNFGVAANFALSTKKANGKYIALCAADDFWHNPDKLKLQVDYLESHPDYGLIYTDYDKLNIHTCRITRNYLKTSHKKIYEGAGLITAFFKGQVPSLTLTIMFRKDLFDKYVPVDDYIKHRFPLEDWPTWLILSKYTKIGYLPISTGTYRYGHESITNPLYFEKIQKRIDSEKIMYRYLCHMFPEDLYYSETGYDLYINGILLNHAYKNSDYTEAKKYSSQIKELGLENLKTKMTRNRIYFYIFAFAKKIRERFQRD